MNYISSYFFPIVCWINVRVISLRGCDLTVQGSSVSTMILGWTISIIRIPTKRNFSNGKQNSGPYNCALFCCEPTSNAQGRFVTAYIQTTKFNRFLYWYTLVIWLNLNTCHVEREVKTLTIVARKRICLCCGSGPHLSIAECKTLHSMKQLR